MTRGAKRVLALLSDGKWHTTAEIEEACQVTAHSRLAEIRATNAIDKRHNHGQTGRRMFSWRLVATAEQLAEIADAEPFSPQTPGSAVGDNLAVPYRDDAAAGSAAPSAAHTFTVGAASHGDDPEGAGAEEVGAASAPAPEWADDDDSDSGWRDLFPAESATEEQQLELGVES